ncbi:malonate decarboxylase acyl carrier protein [Dechloromonas denitrificans]|uniref:malonate decarboxylase acyl carrier protein n=1 Tax=Dechloromonas denitrificans TaxID=281362 RepID=UPI001CF82276|nr:malonate decarboxylase acyl carrier protein [Dechloromonas denitrificans]UCV11520.1 malonate decarboxylase acyl carrier protein [Dechloromonas denitrificans]
METLEFRFDSAPAARAADPALCGVVGSGNLEILIKTGIEPAACRVSIKTSARGFGEVWQAVLGEFAAGHPAGGTVIVINDMGATPAVVTLRLAQGLAEYLGGAR